MQPNNDPGTGGNWTYHNENEGEAGVSQPQNEMPATPAQAPAEPVTWTASEFIAHHKSPGWYAAVISGFTMLGIMIYLITKDVISIVAIGIVVVLFLVAGGKKPEQRPYQVDSQGISIGSRFYPYSLFKSFAMRREGAIGSISFMPLKRLMPEISIYYAPEDEARIVDVLAASLPNDQRKEQSVDRLMKHLRF